MSVINPNPQSAVGARHLNQSQEALGRSLNRLSASSGLARPSEGPPAIGIARKMDALQVRLNAASASIQEGMSQVQAAGGFLQAMTHVLSRLGELASLSQAARNGGDVAPHQQEFAALQGQLRDTIGGTAEEIGGGAVASPQGSFNGRPLFGPTPAGGVSVSAAPGEAIDIPDTNLRRGALLSLIQQDAGGRFLAGATDEGASDLVARAGGELASQRGALGAAGTRLEYAGSRLRVERENLTAALSGARGAEESTQFAKYNILTQSADAILAHGNQAPHGVLTVLRN